MYERLHHSGIIDGVVLTDDEIVREGALFMIARRVENYLTHDSNKSNVIEEMYYLIKKMEVTHYISGVNLGASCYWECSGKKSDLQGGGSAGVDIQGASLQSTLDLAKSSNFNLLTGANFGANVEAVKDVDLTNDYVVEYDIRPLSELLHIDHKRTRKALNKAIEVYIMEKESKYYDILLLCDSHK